MRYALLLCALLLAGCSKAPAPATTKAPDTAAAAKAETAKAEADPFPECAAAREWFRKNLGEPASLEIIEWEGHGRIAGKDGPADWVQCVYRAKNDRGAMQVFTGYITIIDGKAVAEAKRPH